ncbi:hypothetical protein ACFL5F_02720 [Planctomycetota bacterium]
MIVKIYGEFGVFGWFWAAKTKPIFSFSVLRKESQELRKGKTKNSVNPCKSVSMKAFLKKQSQFVRIVYFVMRIAERNLKKQSQFWLAPRFTLGVETTSLAFMQEWKCEIRLTVQLLKGKVSLDSDFKVPDYAL